MVLSLQLSLRHLGRLGPVPALVPTDACKKTEVWRFWMEFAACLPPLLLASPSLLVRRPNEILHFFQLLLFCAPIQYKCPHSRGYEF